MFGSEVLMRAATPEILAIMLRNRRRALGLTQTEVAERCGLSQQTVSAAENRLRVSSLDTLYRLMLVLRLQAGFSPIPDYVEEEDEEC